MRRSRSLGWGEGQSYLDPCSAPSLTGFEGGRLAADTAFSIAGVLRDEIDVAGISDHFTINVIVELEDAGFCAKGDGGAFVEGQATRIGGRLPVNTDGGFLSSSHAGSCGLLTAIELVRQLRHEAGPRQVEGASARLRPRRRRRLPGAVRRSARTGVTMAGYEKFRPEVSALHEPFWAALREHRLALQRCDECGKLRFIPSERCPQCGSPNANWTAVQGTGEVYTYTIVHRAPTPAYQADVPYAIVHVTLDEGPRVISTMVDCAPDDVEIGMHVEVTYDDVADDLTLYRFRPASDAN